MPRLGEPRTTMLVRPLNSVTDSAGTAAPGPPLFLVTSYPSGGTFVKGVATGDLNLDGWPEIVATNYCAQGFMSCDRGGSVVMLGGAPFPSGGNYAGTVAIGDVNNDGMMDLVVANATNPAVMLGAGFQMLVLYDLPGLGGMVLADVNRDGNLDLVTTAAGVLLGNGDGTFRPAPPANAPTGDARGVAVADVNGDDKLDSITVGGGQAWVSLGNGDGTFQPAVPYPAGGGFESGVVVADVNNDGKLDLAVSHSGDYDQIGQVGVLLGNGDGTFQPPLTYSSDANYTLSIAVADINRDGKIDILLVSQCVTYYNCSQDGATGAVSLLLGNGDGTFQPALLYGSGGLGGETITVDDLDLDGRPDLVVGNDCQIRPWGDCPRGGGVIAVFMNKIASTTTSLVSSMNPAIINQAVTYTATVTAQYGRSATGTITFRDNHSTIATVPIANNMASYSTSYPSKGSHRITAAYSGDLANADSVSNTFTETVNPLTRTQLVLTTSQSPVDAFDSVTLTATVTAQDGTVPGWSLIYVFQGKTEICTGSLEGGTATCYSNFRWPGDYSIRAVYPGDETYRPSVGNVTQIVDKRPSLINLGSFPNPSAYGQPVTFIAQVETYLIPTGYVYLMEGPTRIGWARVNEYGVATFTKSKLAVGTHAITAVYVGDRAYEESTSDVLEQVVQPAAP